MALAIQVDSERIGDFCRKWRVKELALFGSALRGDFGPGSDVDVLVELQPDHGLSLWLGGHDRGTGGHLRASG